MALYDVTTIGEAGLRLSVASGTRLATTDHFDVQTIGAEFNVASSLSNLGWSTSWVSVVHESPIGDRVMRCASEHRVDTSMVQRTSHGRTGTYYVEYATAPRPIEVFFDRSGTSFCSLEPASVDWAAFLDTRLVHLTGLTAGLGGQPRSLVTNAVERARTAGVPISFDINYREHLWSPDEAAAALAPLVEQVDLLFCSERDAQMLFGIEGARTEKIKRLQAETNAAAVFMSVGADGLIALIDGKVFEASSRASTVIDRLGAGDGLAAGAIHAWLNDDMDAATSAAAVMAGLALTQHGEQVIASRTELERLTRDTDVNLRR